MSSGWKDSRLGFKVLRRPATPSLNLTRLVKLSTANVSDIMGKLLTFDYRIKPVIPLKERVAGFAITVAVRPGDNPVIFKAMELAQPGDVIVIADEFDTDNSLLGGVMAAMAAAKGIVAFVTDGLVRDAEELEHVGLPVFAQGLTPKAPSWGARVGQINTPICCGGVIVHPGDVVMGDKDGVVVVPTADVETVLSRGKDLKQKEWGWLHPATADGYSLYEKAHAELVRLGCNFEASPESQIAEGGTQ